MTATRVPPEVPIGEARALLADIATAAKEHAATTTLTKRGKPVAQVAPPDAVIVPADMWTATQAAYDKAVTTGLSNAHPVIVHVLKELGRLLDSGRQA